MDGRNSRLALWIPAQTGTLRIGHPFLIHVHFAAHLILLCFVLQSKFIPLDTSLNKALMLVILETPNQAEAMHDKYFDLARKGYLVFCIDQSDDSVWVDFSETTKTYLLTEQVRPWLFFSSSCCLMYYSSTLGFLGVAVRAV